MSIQDNNLKLAWDLVIYTKDNVNWWNVRVDALTNEILETHDLILSCNFEKEHDHNEHLIAIGFSKFDVFSKFNFGRWIVL